MHRLGFVLLLAICCCALGCSSLGFSTYPVAHFMTRQTKDVLASSPSMPPVARELAKEVLLEHRLEPGDEILIEPVEIDSELQLPADQVIAADGTIDLGKFGRVVVASFTLEQAEALVQRDSGRARKE